MALEKYLGQNVQRTRKALGITQEELCEKAQLTQAQLSLIETGKSKLGINTLERLAIALNVPAYELLKNPDLEKQSLKEKVEAIEALPTSKRKSLLMTIDVFLKEHESIKKAK